MEPLMTATMPASLAAYAEIRADCYAMLAALLARAPSEDCMRILRDLSWNKSIPATLDESLTALKRAGLEYDRAAAEQEFDRLFIGLGCGELMPYASWYREKRIQSLPLARLRSAMMALGIVRQTGNREPEDHAAALCEIMSLISRNAETASPASQRTFFQEHVATWLNTFFQDLQSAKSAAFYRAVAVFGKRLLETESEYLKYADA